MKLVHGTAPAPQAPVSVADASPSAPPPSVSGTAAWPVQEAPTSACFKWRVGEAELLYTFRGVTDDEVLTRIREQLPLLQDILAACTASAIERTAAGQAAQPPPPPAQAAPRPQARHQAPEPPRNGHAATNGHANGHRNGQGQRPRPTGDQDTGWCSLHNVSMKHHVNDRGSWFSHTLRDGGYCKGAK